MEEQLSENIKTQRKSISKKLRFEIFKRDSFKCQYCARGAPDVVLHVDHITPVSKGGSASLLNLITSCADCNQGKSDIKLDDTSIVQKQRKQIELLQERREQLEMMLEWHNGVRDMDEIIENELIKYWEKETPSTVNECGRKILRKLIRKYTVEEIIQGMDASIESYLEYDEEGKITRDSINKAWNKIGAVCSVRRAIKEDPDLNELFKIRAYAKKRVWNKPSMEPLALSALKRAREANVEFDILWDIAKTSRSWNDFIDQIDAQIE